MTNVTREEFMDGLRREKQRREDMQYSIAKANDTSFHEYQWDKLTRILHRRKIRGDSRRRRR